MAAPCTRCLWSSSKVLAAAYECPFPTLAYQRNHLPYIRAVTLITLRGCQVDWRVAVRSLVEQDRRAGA